MQLIKRAYLVLGPESSGTRLLTRILIAAGCYGDDGHEQRLDVAIADEPLIVWRRSLPHNRQWPDVTGMTGLLRLRGYAVTALVASRDWHAMALSQVKAPHAPDVSAALVQIQQAYLRIFAALRSTATPFEVVNYEALGMRADTTAHLLARLDLPAEVDLGIYDGNAKYYANPLGGLARDVETIRAGIAERYGCEVSAEYCRDFITLMETKLGLA